MLGHACVMGSGFRGGGDSLVWGWDWDCVVEAMVREDFEWGMDGKWTGVWCKMCFEGLGGAEESPLGVYGWFFLHQPPSRHLYHHL